MSLVQALFAALNTLFLIFPKGYDDYDDADFTNEDTEAEEVNGPALGHPRRKGQSWILNQSS